MGPDSACERLALKQHGALSRHQALRIGLSSAAVARRVTSGRWQKLFPGVYVLSAFPSSWEQQLMGAVLCGGKSAIASHRSAASLWQLDGVSRKPIEISVKAGRRIDGVVVHRRLREDDPALEVIEGIPTTGIERTLLDLAAVVGSARAGVALDDALRRGLTTITRLNAVLAQSRRPGKRALGELLMSRDDRDGILESRLETALLRVLRQHHLPLPVPQYRVVDGARYVARLDFAYPSRRLGLEADGYRWHSSQQSWRRDIRRENALKLLGWTILRSTWRDVHDHPEVVARQVRRALHLPTQMSLD